MLYGAFGLAAILSFPATIITDHYLAHPESSVFAKPSYSATPSRRPSIQGASRAVQPIVPVESPDSPNATVTTTFHLPIYISTTLLIFVAMMALAGIAAMFYLDSTLPGPPYVGAVSRKDEGRDRETPGSEMAAKRRLAPLRPTPPPGPGLYGPRAGGGAPEPGLPDGRPQKVLRIDMTGAPPNLLGRLLVGSYITGQDQVIISARHGLTLEQRKEIRQVVDRTLGMTVVAESPATVEIQNFVDPGKHELPRLLHRVVQLLRAELKVCHAALTQDNARELSQIENLEEEIDRLYLLVVRQLLLSSDNPRIARNIDVESHHYQIGDRLVAKVLEVTGDLIHEIGKDLQENLPGLRRMPRRADRRAGDPARTARPPPHPNHGGVRPSFRRRGELKPERNRPDSPEGSRPRAAHCPTCREPQGRRRGPADHVESVDVPRDADHRQRSNDQPQRRTGDRGTYRHPVASGRSRFSPAPEGFPHLDRHPGHGAPPGRPVGSLKPFPAAAPLARRNRAIDSDSPALM